MVGEHMTTLVNVSCLATKAYHYLKERNVERTQDSKVILCVSALAGDYNEMSGDMLQCDP